MEAVLPTAAATAIAYLAAVEQTLATYGRPRKNPGKNRPVAVLADGLPVSRITGNDIYRIHRISLPGAFQAAEYMVPCTHKTRRDAMMAFYEKYWIVRDLSVGAAPTTFGELSLEITQIDHDMPDTREILRILKATQKKLRREGKVLASAA